jgi:hypothetical protein
VFYTSLGDEARDARRPEGARARHSLPPRHVGARLQLRRVPELEFRFDESIAHQDRIEQILATSAPKRPTRGRRRGPAVTTAVRTDTMVTTAIAGDHGRGRCHPVAAAVRDHLPRASGWRRHRIAAGDGLRAASGSARSARVVSRDVPPAPMLAFPGVSDIEIADRSTIRAMPSS